MLKIVCITLNSQAKNYIHNWKCMVVGDHNLSHMFAQLFSTQAPRSLFRLLPNAPSDSCLKEV